MRAALLESNEDPTIFAGCYVRLSLRRTTTMAADLPGGPGGAMCRPGCGCRFAWPCYFDTQQEAAYDLCSKGFLVPPSGRVNSRHFTVRVIEMPERWSLVSTFWLSSPTHSLSSRLQHYDTISSVFTGQYAMAICDTTRDQVFLSRQFRGRDTAHRSTPTEL